MSRISGPFRLVTVCLGAVGRGALQTLVFFLFFFVLVFFYCFFERRSAQVCKGRLRASLFLNFFFFLVFHFLSVLKVVLKLGRPLDSSLGRKRWAPTQALFGTQLFGAFVSTHGYLRCLDQKFRKSVSLSSKCVALGLRLELLLKILGGP